MQTLSQYIGLMSGTSLDGLDIVHVSFDTKNNEDHFHLLHCETIPYPDELTCRIQSAPTNNISFVSKLDYDLGKFFSNQVNHFIEKHSIDRVNLHAIGCHGQTILHQPGNGFSLQIGNGNVLAYETGLRVVNDFRNLDICSGGQGAPLVPIGDFGLFGSEAGTFLNLGGFANISFKDNSGKIIAYDICPVNLPLNKLAGFKGLSYDMNGDIARSGEINFFLLDLLNSLAYYSSPTPKSLGSEWLESEFYPLIKFENDVENNLRTTIEHIAFQLSKNLDMCNASSVLITGGGARNTFLIERLGHYFGGNLIIPDLKIVDFKEAIVFAYLAFLRLNNRINSLASVTGAKRDLIGGVIHDPGYPC